MVHNTRSLAGLVILASLIAISPGCGGDAKRLDVHPVKGTVHYKGEPMKGGGSILFFPTSGDSGMKEASGTIKEDGTFELKTYEDGDGAAAGEYRVVVYQLTTTEPEASTDGQESGGEPIETVAEKDRIPNIYSDSALSPKLQEVKAGENVLKIELEANPNGNRGA
jgi:hypothetical protein